MKEPEKLTVAIDIKVTHCPCGSGKSPEKCCGPVKPRTHKVDLDMRNYYESDGLAIGYDYSLKRIVNGQLAPLIGEAEFEHSYARAKKRKSIVRGRIRGDKVLHPDSLIMSYDNLFFIDTNTKIINDASVSVTGVIHAVPRHLNGGVELKYYPILLLEFWDAEAPPERLGWYAALSAIVQNRDIADTSNAIFVDSDLASHEEINKRSIPILDDFYLPKNFELKYASSDIGASIANKFLKACDRLASSKINEISINPQIETLKLTTYPCKYFRQWVE